ncbi:hypothetical protein CAPTEDRAFT_225880 [Capitella teleta]|uniref:SLIT-ROBO Rho GTPase-activating protein 1 n=1 Tax=Capitella teleta TaxID=283909 RepID=R7U3E8_CAPTE|nr:hypothetical protein CAPTEDRAFT_225880 [Capitella teleta]|eukprot:ELU00651.1 hypothetical protein CAPTEDRAFT_225880 [Capitella teleta]
MRAWCQTVAIDNVSPADMRLILKWREIRGQLTEQLKHLDVRLETHFSMLLELQEFYRRRAEVELEYSVKLDKLVKNVITRHKQEKQSAQLRREFWPGYSTYTCWQTLLASTKRVSKDHAIAGELYSGQMCNRLADLGEDLQRMYRNCRDIGILTHDELVKVLNELQNAMKTYHVYHGESKQAESKLRYAENQKSKVEQHASRGTISKKFRNFEKQTEKRQAKYDENKKKALKSRNEYLLCLDAANAAVHKYFVDDVPDLIDTIDYGYHNTLGRAMMMHLSAEENMIRSRQGCCDLLSKSISDLDQRSDKQRFLELHNLSFSLPKKFEFQAHKGDEVCQISAQKSVQDEMLDRLQALNDRLNSIKVENEEIWKSLETADKSLMEMINQKDYDVTTLFQEEKQPPKSPHVYGKKRSDRLETEAYYVTKFQGFLISNNLIARLQAKHKSLQKALGEGDGSLLGSRPPSLPPKPKKRRALGKARLVGQPKLFGGSIEEYVEATGQEIPNIVRSCIRIINLYGMHHQGVFRVSGSQHEINDFKNMFEKGDDPLSDVLDGKDINSIAGVLKLYFRELREPLFPTQLFDALIACSSKSSPDLSEIEATQECIERVKELLLPLPRPILVVMRYIFAFLSHLSEYSDENMMDPYNLAICFGPTLLPIPDSRDQVLYQNNVNDLTKTIITHQEEIFPNDGGVVYEKCIVEEEAGSDDVLNNLSDDEDETGDAASEEEPEVNEAEAQYDFQGRTERELSFKKGDIIVVFNQVSVDWWEGAYKGKEGLIPDKYISVRRRDRDSSTEKGIEDVRRSTESLPAKYSGSSSSASDECLDKAASQPNIAMATDPSTSSSSSSSLRTTSSELALGSGDEVDGEKGASADDPLGGFKIEKTTEDLAHDIDSALAEVMSGLELLELQHTDERQPPPIHTKTLPTPKVKSHDPKHTPDLVLDLPITASPESGDESSPPLSTAEVFASNQSTIKKGAASSRVGGMGGAGGFSSGAPVPVLPAGAGKEILLGAKRRGQSASLKVTKPTQPPESSPVAKARTLPIGTKPGFEKDEDRPQSAGAGKHVSPKPPLKKKALPPPLKAKPPIMRKPARSPEVLKKLKEAKE